MGYDLHITRAEEWLNSEQHPILESEWMALIASDPTLESEASSYSSRRAEDGTLERWYPTAWTAHPVPSTRPAFWYENGRIFRKSLDDSTLKKMIEIAHKLDARVIGDDEEEYDEVEGRLRVRRLDYNDDGSLSLKTLFI